MAEKIGGGRRRMVINLPPGLSTRSQNKNQHPGAPDLPNPRRSKAEVTAANVTEEKIRQAQVQARQDAIDRAAAVEDRMRDEEDGNDASGDLSETTSDKVEDSTGLRLLPFRVLTPRRFLVVHNLTPILVI